MKYLLLSSMGLFLSLTAAADYSIDWYTIDGGGGQSSGGSYVVTGTIGQPDAGYHNSGQYELLGGFWVGGPLCIVNLEDFAQLAAFWLEEPCDAGNNWCGGADLNQMNNVDLDDLSLLVGQWLNACPFGWPL